MPSDVDPRRVPRGRRPSLRLNAANAARILAFANTLPCGIVCFDGDTIRTNTAFDTLSGYTADWFSSATQWADTVFGPDHDLGAWLSESGELLRSRTASIRRADGARRIVRITVCDASTLRVYSVEDVTDGEETLAALEETQRSLSLLLSHLPGMAYRCRHDQFYTMEFVSDGCFPLTGYLPMDLIGNARIPFIDVTHPDDRERTRNEIDAAVAANVPYTLSFRIITATGSEKWVSEQGAAVVDDAGQIVALEGFIQDVTAETLAREQLQHREALLEESQRMASVGSWESDVDSRIVWWSDELYRIAGLERDEAPMTVERFLAIIHPADRAAILDTFDRVMREPGPYSYDQRIIRPDGEIRHVTGHAYPVTDDMGRVRTLRGTEQDVTARVHASESLRFIADASALLASSVDVNTLLTDLSQLAVPLLGDVVVIHLIDDATRPARIGAVAGTPRITRLVEEFLSILDPDDPHGLLAEVIRSRMPQRSSPAAPDELARMRARNPRLAEILLAADAQSALMVPLIAREQVIGAMTFVVLGPPRDEVRRRDLAVELAGRAAVAIQNARLYEAARRELEQRREVETQLLQAQKMEAVGLLAGGIAHDFNNLLTVISGSAEMTLSKMAENDPLRPDIIEVRRASDRAAALTRQLLTFSRRSTVHPELVSLNDLVLHADSMLRRLIGAGIDLRTVVSPLSPMITIDPGQLEQALVNLVVNARDAMAGDGRLVIATSVVTISDSAAAPEAPPGSWVVLSVSDTGTGMDEATKARIFEPFFTTKESGKGTGLGLATVFGIIRQAGGHIVVDSTPGTGTTFKLFFPPATLRGGVSSVTMIEATDARGAETVLLVEDDPYVRRLARRALEDRGYAVLEASSGPEALEVADATTGPIHILLTDVDLPELNGREVWERLEPRCPGLKVLFMSGYAADALLQHRIASMNLPFLEKPFSPSALGVAIRRALDARPED